MFTKICKKKMPSEHEIVVESQSHSGHGYVYEICQIGYSNISPWMRKGSMRLNHSLKNCEQLHLVEKWEYKFLQCCRHRELAFGMLNHFWTMLRQVTLHSLGGPHINKDMKVGVYSEKVCQKEKGADRGKWKCLTIVVEIGKIVKN